MSASRETHGKRWKAATSCRICRSPLVCSTDRLAAVALSGPHGPATADRSVAALHCAAHSCDASEGPRAITGTTTRPLHALAGTTAAPILSPHTSPAHTHTLSLLLSLFSLLPHTPDLCARRVLLSCPLHAPGGAVLARRCCGVSVLSQWMCCTRCLWSSCCSLSWTRRSRSTQHCPMHNTHFRREALERCLAVEKGAVSIAHSRLADRRMAALCCVASLLLSLSVGRACNMRRVCESVVPVVRPSIILLQRLPRSLPAFLLPAFLPPSLLSRAAADCCSLLLRVLSLRGLLCAGRAAVLLRSSGAAGR